MRRSIILLAFALAASALPAQRHSGSPPTAPPRPAPPPVAVSSGLGAIQFAEVNYGVPAPQSLTRQLRFDDDRTRAAALSAIGAPGQYLQRGHVGMPHSIQLDFAQLGSDEDLDALLTVELDQHLVTAVLIPVDGNWRRIATFIYATPFEDTANTPTTWVRTARAMIQADRYRAIFHASTGSTSGNFVENEAHLRIVNNKPVITISFESTVRECTAPPTAPAPGKPAPRSTAKPGCNITQRWFRPDPDDPNKRFDLITATGHMSPKDAEDPLASSRTMMMSHLRTFTCQPYLYSDTDQRYEPTAPNGPCPTK